MVYVFTRVRWILGDDPPTITTISRCCDGDEFKSPTLVATSSVENAVFSQYAGNNEPLNAEKRTEDRTCVSGLSRADGKRYRYTPFHVNSQPPRVQSDAASAEVREALSARSRVLKALLYTDLFFFFRRQRKRGESSLSQLFMAISSSYLLLILLLLEGTCFLALGRNAMHFEI